MLHHTCDKEPEGLTLVVIQASVLGSSPVLAFATCDGQVGKLLLPWSGAFPGTPNAQSGFGSHTRTIQARFCFRASEFRVGATGSHTPSRQDAP